MSQSGARFESGTGTILIPITLAEVMLFSRPICFQEIAECDKSVCDR